MNENQLKTLCFALAAIGISILYVSLSLYDLKTTRIYDINERLVGNKIKTCGAVRELKTSTGGTETIILYDTKDIRVVFFKNNAINSFDFDFGDYVCVTGAVKKYNQQLEIVGETVNALQIT